MAECTCANPMAVASAIAANAAVIANAITTTAAQGMQQNQQHHAENMKQMDEIHQTLYGESMGGSQGAPAPIRFAHAAPTEYGPVGEHAWTTFFEGATLAIALANSIAQGQIAEKQRDLSDKYYDMAKAKWDRFESKYMPLEKQLVNETSTEPIRELECVKSQARAEAAVSSAYSMAQNALRRWSRRTHNPVPRDAVIEMLRQEVLMTVDSRAYNIEDDRWFTDYANDKRWNRRSAVLNIGRNTATDALKYGDIALKTFGAVGGQINAAASGVVSALGYYGGRNDTFYPTTFLNSYGNSGNSVLIDTHLQQTHNATNALNATS